jgi:hypothetical protein
MVRPIVYATFGPRLGHETLSPGRRVAAVSPARTHAVREGQVLLDRRHRKLVRFVERKPAAFLPRMRQRSAPEFAF